MKKCLINPSFVQVKSYKITSALKNTSLSLKFLIKLINRKTKVTHNGYFSRQELRTSIHKVETTRVVKFKMVTL